MSRSFAHDARILWGFCASGIGPMPERQKTGLWKLINILRVLAALASFSYTSIYFICSSYEGRVAALAVGLLSSYWPVQRKMKRAPL